MAELATKWLNLDSNSLYNNGGALTVKVKESGGVSLGADGLYVGTGAITNTMLAGSIAFDKLADYANIARLDQTENIAEVWNFGSNLPTASATPTTASQLVRKAYVDSLFLGRSWKDPVRAVVAADTVLEGLSTFDGVALDESDRVLVTGQTDASENGIYIASVGAWVRADDLAAAATAAGMHVHVNEGTTYEDTVWYCTNDSGSDVVGTDDLTITQAPSGGSAGAGAGLVYEGDDLAVSPGVGIQLSGDTVAIKLNGTALAVDANGLTINSAGVAAAHIAAAVAGNGLTGAAGDPLSIDLDGTTLSVSASGLKINAGGVTGTQLATSVAGNGLTGGGGDALAVGSGNGINVGASSVALGALTGNWATGGNYTITGLPTPTDSGHTPNTGWITTNFKVIKTETFQLSAQDATNKYKALAANPSTPGEVRLYIRNGPNVHYGVDFEMHAVNLNYLDWSGLALQNQLEENDYITVVYPKTVTL